MHVRWLRLVARITYLSKLIGTPSLAACLKLELFRVYFYFALPTCHYSSSATSSEISPLW
nr:hypothetical protein B7L52_17720 [Pectobacterium carotovorum]